MFAAFFTPDEMKCKCGQCGSTGLEMSPVLMQKLDMLRSLFGAPLTIASGYRCPAYNQKVSTTGEKGPHTTGKAVDILIDRKAAYTLLGLAIRVGFSGFGFKQNGLTRFIHFDILTEAEGYPRPTIWTY